VLETDGVCVAARSGAQVCARDGRRVCGRAFGSMASVARSCNCVSLLALVAVMVVTTMGAAAPTPVTAKRTTLAWRWGLQMWPIGVGRP
jgi:hypothetical protein